MSRTLVVTNDFPPRPGGIQQFVHGLAVRQPPGSLVVYTSTSDGAAAFDAAQPFPVVRNPTALLLPTPAVAREVAALARSEGCDRVWFGAAAPLGLLARRLDLERSVASTHGHEVGWAATPGTRQLLRRIGGGVDVVTYLGAWTRSKVEPALGPHPAYAPLTGGVDEAAFRPGAGGAEVRRRLGLGTDQPVVVCVSRLVPRKGQDTLVRAMATVRAAVPGAVLLLVGDGSDRARLERLAAPGEVVFTGAVPWAALPAHYDAGDVFALPCRDRVGSWQVEGLGIVFLEAAATGLPVVVGRSGGAPDAVRAGVTGFVVDPTDVAAVAAPLVRLLLDPALRARMGAAGRAWVEQEWRWGVLADRLAGLLV